MKERLSSRWQKVPITVRRPLVLTVGMFFILLSGTIGWLPGPGGIPIFLLGIAILASEFHWAERVKQGILRYVHMTARWMRNHKAASAVIILAGIASSSIILYMLFIV